MFESVVITSNCTECEWVCVHFGVCILPRDTTKFCKLEAIYKNGWWNKLLCRMGGKRTWDLVNFVTKLLSKRETVCVHLKLLMVGFRFIYYSPTLNYIKLSIVAAVTIRYYVKMVNVIGVPPLNFLSAFVRAPAGFICDVEHDTNGERNPVKEGAKKVGGLRKIINQLEWKKWATLAQGEMFSKSA